MADPNVTDPHRVLVGAADPATVEALVVMVEETGAAVTSHATTSNEVATRLRESHCDIALLHVDLGPLPVLELVRELSLEHPETAVVVVVDQASDTTLGQAMRAGARGVLATPFQLDEVQAVLDGVGTWAQAVRSRLEHGTSPPEVALGSGLVVLSGAKGGVGTTTLAVQLCVAAAEAGPDRKVCLVDLDLQGGDVRTLLDITHARGIVDLVGVAQDLSGRQLSESLFPHDSRVRVLLGPEEGEQGERVTGDVVRSVLGGLRTRFDVVVVDAGTQVNDAVAVATEMADDVLLVVTPDVLCARAATRRLELWSRLRIRREGVRVVVNRASRDAEVQPDLVRRLLGVEVMGTAVPASFRELEGATNTGHPERVEDGRLRDQVRELGRELGMVPRPTRRRWSAFGRQPAHAGANGTRVAEDAGSAVVEAVGLLPLVLLVGALVLQVVVWGMTYVVAHHAAREGAHAVLTGNDAAAAALADVPDPWLDRAAVAQGDGGVRVTLGVPSLVPVVDLSAWRVGVTVGNGGLAVGGGSWGAGSPGGGG